MNTYDEATIKAMREWVADCVWRDLMAEDVASLTDAEIVAGVQKHYAGGLDAFLAAIQKPA